MKLLKSVIFCTVLMLVSMLTNISKAFLNKAKKINTTLENKEGSLKGKSNKVEGNAIVQSSSTTKTKTNTNTGTATETDSEDCGCDDD